MCQMQSLNPKIKNFIIKKYEKVYGKPIEGVKYYNRGDGTHYIVEINYRQVHSVSSLVFARAALERGKLYVIDSCKVLYIDRKFKPEVGFGAFVDAYQSIMRNINMLRNVSNTLKSTDFKLFLIDVLALVLHIREGYLTFTKMGSILLMLYTSYMRFHNMFEPQANPSVVDLVMGFTVLGAPSSVIEKLKTFTAITGKRIMDSELITSVLAEFLQLIMEILDFMHRPHFGCQFIPDNIYAFIVAVLDKLCGHLSAYTKIKKVADVYTRYVRNPQETFDPAFRELVIATYDSCKGDENFLEYVSNANNKYFATTWQLFKDNIVKSVSAFEESRREEPICIVFEGEPGSGKSAMMNMFVDLLRRANRTVYCHAFPASEDGKDFYDDYENQEVFVVDDIGQQGVSQWRYIINFVSPVKYPLPCATASKKNTKFFNSKVILCTTNCLKNLQAVTSSDCISDLNALKRRCHVIEVVKAPGEGFAQYMQYYKFDHLDSKHWEPTLLHHNRGNVPVKYDGTQIDAEERTKSALSFVWQLFMHIQKCEDRNRRNMAIDNDLLDSVLRMQPEALPSINDIMSCFDFTRIGLSVPIIIKEWYSSVKRLLVDWFKTALSNITNMFQSDFEVTILGMELKFNPLTSIVFAMLGISLWYVLFRESEDVDGFEDIFNKLAKKLREENKQFQPRYFTPQADIAANERINNIKKFCKTIRIKEDKHSRDDDIISQCVVSGNNVLLPAHVNASGKRVDVYQTYEHYKNNHTEVENVELELIRCFIGCDMAVYRFKNMIPIYKKCHNVFPEVDIKTMDLFLVNSLGDMPVIFGKHVVPNVDSITYASVVGKITHAPDSGYITPYSGNGACGTVLADAWGGIVGFHVAGNGSEGFCVVPDRTIAHEIRTRMLDGFESKMELDDKVIPDFSGVRMRYDADQVKISHPIKESVFVPTVYHESFNADMRNMRSVFKVPIVAVAEEVGLKQPPIFREGNVTAQDRLVEMSQKTFMHQGYITKNEAAYIDKCLDSMMIDFVELEDQVCAFGNADFQPLNKDSSNGYGCLRDKEDYFDFSEKIILPTAVELINNFKNVAVNDPTNFNYYLCKETFKDELRKESKVRTPRTFRVMPLGHIWWTKKIFGNIITHFRDNKHKYGCAIGFNPYTDFHVLAGKLQNLPITGDVDFAKWDGSVMAHVMEIILEVFLRHYKGNNVEVARYIFMTMWNSQVLVGDAVWSTTHGLPSGTWLTLLLNCLINKALSALVLCRNKPDASVKDFHSVVDYVMGDDKIFGCDAEMGKYYNLLTIEKVAKSLGMTCTNGDKTPIKSKTQPFNKLSFVKRNFVKHLTLNKWMGALSLETLHNTLQWRDSTKDIDQVMEGKMRSVQVEAYVHSPVLFREYTRVFNKHYPFTALFSEEQVKNILMDDDTKGYHLIASGLGKEPERWM